MESPEEKELSGADYLHLLLWLTRGWIQYGLFGFAIACILISAVEGAFER